MLDKNKGKNSPQRNLSQKRKSYTSQESDLPPDHPESGKTTPPVENPFDDPDAPVTLDTSDMEDEYAVSKEVDEDELSEQVRNNILAWIREGEAEPSINLEARNEIDLESLTTGLTQGVKRLSFLLEQARIEPGREVENHFEAANLVCKMLKTVRGNKPFRNAAKNLTVKREQDEIEVASIIMNLDELKKFIQKEAELLNHYNLPNAGMYVREGFNILINVPTGKVRHTHVLKAIEDLRIEACRLRDDLEKQTPQTKNRERTKQIIIKISMGIGAVIIALINVQAEVEGILTPSQATLSGYMASGIIGAAATDIWSLA